MATQREDIRIKVTGDNPFFENPESSTIELDLFNDTLMLLEQSANVLEDDVLLKKKMKMKRK